MAAIRPRASFPRLRTGFGYSKSVKRKRPTVPEASSVEVAAIPAALLEEARRALQTDRVGPSAKCVVCGDACAPNSVEELCWVCRRLKLSAWRDSDSQMPAQE